MYKSATENRKLHTFIRENNERAGKTYVYEYDSRGNILSKKTYTYTTGELGTPTGTRPYYYDFGAWGDQLINYNSHYRMYDSLGNPTSYEKTVNGNAWTFNFTWEKGRQLASATYGTNSVTYEYDSDGLRTQKTVNGVVYDYYWQGGKLVAMTVTNGSTVNKMVFYYDASGIPASFTYNGTYYCYITNLQGDVIGIANYNGVIGTYSYDAWGNILSTNTAGSAEDLLLKTNPLRYRGYIYDTETGFYYLQSRYYDPEVCRFINADSQINFGFVGTNLYSYCYNNPVNYIDENGKIGVLLTCAIVLGTTIIATNLMTLAQNTGIYVGTLVLSTFDDEVKEDMESINWNFFNTDENAVAHMNKVSFYKGSYVTYNQFDFISSYAFLGIIHLQDKSYITTDEIKHEYGHLVQESILGFPVFLTFVCVPSVVNCILANVEYYQTQDSNIERKYNSKIWERTANLLGGVEYEGYYPFWSWDTFKIW